MSKKDKLNNKTAVSPSTATICSADGRGRNAERLVRYQHEETGNIFTKLIPENEPIPEFPRRFIVSVENV